MALLEKAFLLASALHNEQKRKASIVPGAPYISHLIEVAGMALANGGDEETGAAALLHDALEDVSEAVAQQIEAACGSRVMSLVRECTEVGTGKGGEFKAPWRERKEAYLHHLLFVSASALLISVADKLQSARELKRQVRIQGNEAYKSYAKKEYATVEERKEAVLWFHRSLEQAFHYRLELLNRDEPQPMLVGIQALILDFGEVVAQLERGEF